MQLYVVGCRLWVGCVEIQLKTFNGFQGGEISAHHIQSDVHVQVLQALVDGRLLGYHLSFVHQLAFADVSAVAHVQFTSSRIFTEGNAFCFIVCPSLRASLLRVAAFGIWHCITFLVVFELIQSFPDWVGFGFVVLIELIQSF